MMNNILIIVTMFLIAPIIIINQSGVPMYFDNNTQSLREVITPYHTFQQLLPQAYGSSAWLEEQRECTDIWQETHDESLYYTCWAILDKDLEQ